jgi:S1-C subfamily serine protease
VLRSMLVISVAMTVVAVVPAGPAAATQKPDPAAKRAAEAVIPGVVYVQSQLSDGVIVGGTGMVLTRGGEVLTNYHLVHDEVTVGVFDLGDHRVHHAHVVGVDATHDVAVLQIEQVHDLPIVHLAHDPAEIGQAVVAVGNGGGRLGEHPGRITGTGKTLTAQDPESGPETIKGLLQTDARLTPGDSGGPLIATTGPDAGRVVGMDTAGLFVRHGKRTTPVAGYAIPIGRALEIARRIEDRTSIDQHDA